MSIHEKRFGLDRRSANHPFFIKEIDQIHVGTQGDKFVTEIQSKRGSHGVYILKEMATITEAEEQVAIYEHFKEHGARVPDIFRPAIFADGQIYMLISDLRKNDRYWVYAKNNPETKEVPFVKLANRVQLKTKLRLTSELMTAINVGLIEMDNSIICELWENAFFLAINPKDPDDCAVYVGDFGDVLLNTFSEREKVSKHNILSAASFYAKMFGEPLILPKHYQPLQRLINKRSEIYINTRARV